MAKFLILRKKKQLSMVFWGNLVEKQEISVFARSKQRRSLGFLFHPHPWLRSEPRLMKGCSSFALLTTSLTPLMGEEIASLRSQLQWESRARKKKEMTLGVEGEEIAGQSKGLMIKPAGSLG
jgi:hypothetical protein